MFWAGGPDLHPSLVGGGSPRTPQEAPLMHKPGKAGRSRAMRNGNVPSDREHAELSGLQQTRRLRPSSARN
eukprot:1238203-Alexandrium_andersonii.AAC.1